MNENENNLASRSQLANDIVKSHVLWAIGAGALPLPIIDVASVTLVQVDMLKQLSALYGVNYSENMGKSVVSAIAGGLVSRLGTSFIKAIPVIGSLVGGISMAALSGATTYALGQVFIRNFEQGNQLSEINIKSAKQLFNKAFEKGKKYVSDLQNKNVAE